MPDYNLGRAHGEITITADTRGAVEAQSAMAATAAEARILDTNMGRVNQQFAENQRQSVSTAQQIVRQRQQVEDLQRTYQRYFDEYQRALSRTKEAEDALSRARKDENSNTNTLLRLSRDVERSRDSEERLLGRVEQAHARYQSRLASVQSEVVRFNEAHIRATTTLSTMRVEAERVGEALESLSGKLSSVLRIVGQGGIIGMFGLGSAASTSTMGAAGLSGLSSMVSGVIESVQQLSGVVALLPAVVGAGAVALGTLATAFQGVGAAISSVGDPTKFLDAIKQLAPAAREAMVVFYSFQDAIRGVRFAIQQATFEPFVAQLQPLIRTWLPLLQEGGKQIGAIFGQMASQVMSFLQTAGAQQGFQTFIQNMATGMRAASQAIQPLLQAFQTLSVVGSSFFGRIGNAITQVANEFNKWVEGAASTGKLQAWINQALTGFTNLAHIVMNVGEGIANFFAIGDRFGGGFLEFVRNLTQEFVNWTQSAQGIETISNFFNLLHAAGQAVTPILRLVGEGLATVGGALTRLGIDIAPAVTSFFQSIVSALHSLAPTIQQAGPAISQFLVQLGQVILQIVQQAGPELPKIFQGLSDALVSLAPILPRVVAGIAAILDHLSGNQIAGLFEAAVAIKAITVAFGLFTAVLDLNPITLAIAAIALLAAGVAAATTNFQGFGDTVANALQPLDRLAGQAYDWGKNLISNFINGISEMLQPLDNVVGKISQTVTDFLQPGSPTKRGPLSQMSTEEMGSRLSQGYASGLSSGTGAVESASSSVAGGVAGTTGLGFSSAGSSGRSGVGASAQGNSGFDKYIGFLTKDLTAWNNIFRESFGLFQTTANTIVQTIKVAASIWGGGDNPLTRPGGIAGPPILWGQQNVPGVQSVQQPGKAPIPELAQLGGPPANQQGVPGVQNVNPQGRPVAPGRPGATGGTQPPGPGSAGGGFAGAAGTSTGAAPAGATPSAAVGAPPIVVNPDGTVSSPDPAWQHLLTRESGGRNVLQGDIPGDPNTGANKAQGYFQITPDTWRSNGGEQFAPNPMAATPQQQAIVAGRIFAARGGQPWGAGGVGRENEAQLRAGITPAVAPTSTQGATPPPQPYGLPHGTDTGGYGNPAANQTFPQWVLDLGRQFNVRPSTYGGHQESDRGGEPGYAPNPQGLNRGIDWVGSRADMERFAQALIQYGGAEGSQGALEQVIYQAGPGGTKYGLGGAGNVRPGYYPQSGEGSYDEHGGLDTGAHVHTRFSASVPPTLSARPPDAVLANQPRVPGLLRGEAQTIGSNLTIPGQNGLSGTDFGIAAGGGIAIAEVLRRTIRGVRGANGALLEARFQQALLRTGSVSAAIDEIAGIAPEVGDQLRGVAVNLGGVPRSEFANLSPIDQRGVASDLQAFRGVGVRGGISGGPPLGEPNVPATVAGDAGGALRSIGRGAGGALDAAAIPLLINQAGQTVQDRPAGPLAGAMGIAAPTIIGGAALAGASAAGIGAAPALLGAGILGAISTATGAATGQESTQTPGVIYGPNGQVLSAGPRRTGTAGVPPANPPASTQGRPPANTNVPGGVQIAPGVIASGGGPAGPVQINRASSGFAGAGGRADIQAGIGQAAQSQPVHVTNPQDLPGGNNAGPSTQAVRPTDVQGPIQGPQVRPSFAGRTGAAQTNPPAQVQGQQQPAQAGPPGSVDYKGLYDPSKTPGQLPFKADSPLQAFESGLASVGNIASDAFKIFDDIIQNISATANITDTLVRGVANTEDIVKIIQNFQTYIKTAADVAHLVGDVGGMVGGASGGMDFGAGAGIQAIAGIVSSALEGVNQAITLGIDIYHEVGKYAAFFFGEFLGGPNTGPLGGNVRMMLNTRTNQLYTYSEDNPLNKNTINVPSWQRSYTQQASPAPTVMQNNFYVGPGTSPQQAMSDNMWMVTTGGAPVASVAGRD